VLDGGVGDRRRRSFGLLHRSPWFRRHVSGALGTGKWVYKYIASRVRCWHCWADLSVRMLINRCIERISVEFTVGQIQCMLPMRVLDKGCDDDGVLQELIMS
jgi:hypothetical protein